MSTLPTSSTTPACRAGALPSVLIAQRFAGLETETWNEATVVRQLPIQAYHSQPEVSSSQERDAARSMELFHGRHITGDIPKFSSSSTELGQDIHDWYENQDDSLSWLVRAPKETLTPTGLIGKKAQDWAAKEGIPEGSRLVSEAHYWKVMRIVAALKANPISQELLDNAAHKELSFFWEQFGLGLRTRADLMLEDGTLVDLKTTSCEDIDREFGMSVAKFGYHRQEAFYRLGLMAAGTPVRAMQFVIVQTSEPFQVRVRTIPRELIVLAEASVTKTLQEIQRRIEWNDWTFEAAEEVRDLRVPQWIFTELQND